MRWAADRGPSQLNFLLENRGLPNPIRSPSPSSSPLSHNRLRLGLANVDSGYLLASDKLTTFACWHRAEEPELFASISSHLQRARHDFCCRHDACLLNHQDVELAPSSKT